MGSICPEVPCERKIKFWAKDERVVVSVAEIQVEMV